ncbi:MAG TPA: choice-of-anchor P family protein [Acidimicrobiales bacterium]|nr:choice-of-anchor P family protein [Acidimicrobiales bacterium]
MWRRALVAVFALVLAGAAPAGADSDRFGGYELLARGNGLQVTYDSPGLVPVGPAFQASVPEALASSSSGTNYALASLAYPGPVLADLSTVLAQSNPDLPRVVPPYPVRTQAFYPSGPTTEAQSGGTAEMRSATDADSSLATASWSGTDVGPLVQTGSVKGASETRVDDARVTSRTRVTVSGVDLLGGLVHADAVVTDLVAVSDGKASSSDGHTTVQGLTVLGLAATVDGTGLHVAERPPDPARPPGALDPVLGPVVGSTTTLPPGVTDAARPLLDNLDAVLAKLGPDATVTDALAAAGITLRLLEPAAHADKATATRAAGGLELEVKYSAAGDPLAGPFLKALVPPGSLPKDCPVPGAPVDCSPEGLVSLLTRTHIGALAVAPASVRAAATPPYEALDATFTAPQPLPPGQGEPLALPPGTPLPAPAFATPAPSLPSSGGAGGGLLASAFGRAVPAALVVLLLLSAPLWAAASRRLAAAALAEGGGHCPDGLDRQGGG